MSRTTEKIFRALRRVLLFLLALWVVSVKSLDAETLVIRAHRVYPVSRPPIEPGEVLVRDGKIVEVGAHLSHDTLGVRVVEVSGSIAPGLIDCGSDLGVLGRSAEEWSELTPEIRVLDSLDLDHPALARALAAGVTCAAISPGARNVIGGLGAVVRTSAVSGPAADRVLAREAFLDVSLSEEASLGNFNLRFSRPFTYTFRIPNTRMGTVFLARRAFFEAMDHPDPEKLPAMLSPTGKARLRESLLGQRPLRVHANHTQEILAALRLAEEFKLRIQIVGGGQSTGLIPRLAADHVAVLLDPGMAMPEEQPESEWQLLARLPALLSEAGLEFAYASRDGNEVPLLRSRAAFSLRHGVSEDRMLEALTLGAARVLGVQARVGSLESGKDADLVAFSGDPLDVTSSVLWTMTAGRIDQETEQEF